MAGHAGTVRSGEYADLHNDKPDAKGRNKLHTQANGKYFEEQHALFDPTQFARPSGTTLGGKPGDMAGYQEHMYEAMCNHDGFIGGNTTLLNMDEQKILNNTIFSAECEYADDEQKNWQSDERTA